MLTPSYAIILASCLALAAGFSDAEAGMHYQRLAARDPGSFSRQGSRGSSAGSFSSQKSMGSSSGSQSGKPKKQSSKACPKQCQADYVSSTVPMALKS